MGGRIFRIIRFHRRWRGIWSFLRGKWSLWGGGMGESKKVLTLQNIVIAGYFAKM